MDKKYLIVILLLTIILIFLVFILINTHTDYCDTSICDKYGFGYSINDLQVLGYCQYYNNQLVSCDIPMTQKELDCRFKVFENKKCGVIK